MSAVWWPSRRADIPTSEREELQRSLDYSQMVVRQVEAEARRYEMPPPIPADDPWRWDDLLIAAMAVLVITSCIMGWL